MLTDSYTKVTLPKHSGSYNYYRYLDNVDHVFVNDDNERHYHCDGSWTAKNTEIIVNKNKKTLLVTVGDSWTYGEGIEGINHRAHQWDIQVKINETYNGKLARLLDSDLWTFGCPGNTNSAIIAGLGRILKSIDRNKYDSVKVVVLLTSVDRENLDTLDDQHPIKLLRTNVGEKITPFEWFCRYEQICLNLINDIVISNADLNIDAVVTKNFNRFISTSNYEFRIIQKPWMEFNAEWHGLALPVIYYTHPAFISDNLTNVVIQNDYDFLNQELDNWEKYSKFFLINETHSSSHPNSLGHSLWTQYLITQTKWPVILREVT